MQFRTNSSIIMKVPKQVFVPAPNVDSAVVKIVTKSQFERFPTNEQLFYRLVKSEFSIRRKTLVNNLSQGFSMPKDVITEILEELGHLPTVRAEELSVEDFISLSDRFAHI